MKQRIFSIQPFLLIAIVLGCGLTGCGSGASLKGTLTMDGAPVQGGSLTFVPVEEGKPASTTVNTDGTFDLTGVPLGKVKVNYSPPTGESDAHGQAEKSPYAGAKLNPAEIEVTSGATLELKLEKK